MLGYKQSVMLAGYSNELLRRNLILSFSHLDSIIEHAPSKFPKKKKDFKIHTDFSFEITSSFPDQQSYQIPLTKLRNENCIGRERLLHDEKVHK